MHLLVIGGVAAGTKAAAKYKRLDRAAKVTVLSKSRDISYAGCGLPYYVGGMIESREELIVNTPAKYSALTGVDGYGRGNAGTGAGGKPAAWQCAYDIDSGCRDVRFKSACAGISSAGSLRNRSCVPVIVGYYYRTVGIGRIGQRIVRIGFKKEYFAA